MNKKYGFVLLLAFVSITVYANIAGVNISSSPTLPNTKDNIYDITALSDKNLQTAWCVSGDDAIGASITIKSTNKITGFGILNGYIKTDAAYKNNSRIKEGSVTIDGKTQQTIVFHDSFRQGWIELTGSPGREITISVADIYQGSKYKDLCITELFLDKEVLEGFLKLNARTVSFVGKKIDLNHVAMNYDQYIDEYASNPELFEIIISLYSTWNDGKSLTALINLNLTANFKVTETSEYVRQVTSKYLIEQVIQNPDYALEIYTLNLRRDVRELIENAYAVISANKNGELARVQKKEQFSQLGTEIKQQQELLAQNPDPCVCPGGNWSSEGDIPFLTHSFGTERIMACGHSPKENGDGSEFVIYDCKSHKELEYYWGTNEYNISVKNNSVVVIHYEFLPIGKNWAWKAVEYTHETYSPDSKGGYIHEYEKVFKVPVLTEQQMNEVRQQYSSMKKGDPVVDEAFVYQMMLVALNGNQEDIDRFLKMKDDFIVDGAVSEEYSNALYIFKDNKKGFSPTN